MKRLGPAIAWGLNRFIKLFGNIISFFIRCFVPVKKGRIMCWAYNFKQYGCNPRYISEYLLDNNEGYDIYWVFRSEKYAKRLDKRAKFVRFRSWRYFVLVNTAEFLITNTRTDPYRIYWHKRKGQKYIMTWHGGVALKRVEKDVEDKLGFGYVKKAKYDSKACDLMISGCKAQTALLKEKFWYSGEILEKGVPRNDIFFHKETHEGIKAEICSLYNIPQENRLVIYAPTFRRNHSLEPYSIRWSEVIPHLKTMLKSDKVTVLLRLHPNLIGKADTSSLLNAPEVVDVTLYHDMQNLLCVSDVLITDYSSSMFDFTMLLRPCILFATDVEQYDRGFYYKFHELPYPLARNQEELIETLKEFDETSYRKRLQEFFDDKIGLFESGQASRCIAGWIKEHSLK